MEGRVNEVNGRYIGEGKGGAVWGRVMDWRLGQYRWEEKEERARGEGKGEAG